jgi:hypothetical protein
MIGLNFWIGEYVRVPFDWSSQMGGYKILNDSDLLMSVR